ncbi:MAG TPA: hypothetical protein VJ672_05195, partial [Gemmatimonadaceae bacterium]|nr:hypothetical protein [Gemmatimonadaceae bacterium]
RTAEIFEISCPPNERKCSTRIYQRVALGDSIAEGHRRDANLSRLRSNLLQVAIKDMDAARLASVHHRRFSQCERSFLVQAIDLQAFVRAFLQRKPIGTLPGNGDCLYQVPS